MMQFGTIFLVFILGTGAGRDFDYAGSKSSFSEVDPLTTQDSQRLWYNPDSETPLTP